MPPRKVLGLRGKKRSIAGPAVHRAAVCTPRAGVGGETSRSSGKKPGVSKTSTVLPASLICGQDQRTR
jgi:hypothetical protein